MFFSNINLVGVLVAAVSAFVVGFVWYSPAVFGKAWAKASGHSDNSAKEKEKGGMWKKLLMSFICTLVTAYVASVLFHSLFIVGGMQLLIAAFSVWLGFTAMTKSGDVLFAGDSLTLYFINIGHDLAALVVIFFVVSLFK